MNVGCIFINPDSSRNQNILCVQSFFTSGFDEGFIRACHVHCLQVNIIFIL